MKACVQYFLACLLLICPTLAAALDAGERLVFRVAYENKTQFPNYLGDTQAVLPRPGAAVELVKLLEERIPGLEVRFSRYPWKRCLAMLETGQVDAIFNASFRPERLEIGRYPQIGPDIDPSRRVTTISYHLYAYPDTILGWDGQAFQEPDLEIGAPLGYSIVPELEALGVDVISVRSSMQNLQLLAARRVHAVALQAVTGDFLLRKHPEELAGIQRVEPPLSTKPYYLMLSRQFHSANPELAERIWNAIGRLREEKMELLSDAYLADEDALIESINEFD